MREQLRQAHHDARFQVGHDATHRLLCRLDPTTLLEQEEEDDATPEEDLFG